MQRQHDVFLSYSHADSKLMQRVRTSLIESGLTVWTDDNLEPGTASWTRAIDIAIREVGSFIVILSPDAARSSGVGEELNFARIQEKKLFTILARGDEKSSVPFGVTAVQWIDIRNEENYQSELDRLVITLKNYLKIDINRTQDTPQQQIQEAQITEQIYKQLRDYRAKILSYEIEKAVKIGDIATAQRAISETERDYKIIEIDYELSRKDISPTREYFLKWMRILENYHFDSTNYVAGGNMQGAIEAGKDASRKLRELKEEFNNFQKTVDEMELRNQFYLEALKLTRTYKQISERSLKQKLAVDDNLANYLIKRLIAENVIENSTDENGYFKSI